MKITPHVVPRSLTTEEGDAPAKRYLRKRSTTNGDEEERAFPLASLAKKFGGKLKRLIKYNAWIFTGKKPQDITNPRYHGYWNFFHNRMTPGGKYN
ncbi:hypothetical protein PHYPSEUDO_005478 [Phytophthora pseudosyringae]|uniref:RxLR effector protein n=1 Tax=Phytophthora pseudosyringae TaxID=221518 RepID=A0A8T1VLU2_9STRA|nr:hypothetical protein PHYPSEUDO_005478 [Phytophthora pseudosyringae]